MAGDRFVRILASLTAGGDATLGPGRLCEAITELAAVSGAGIMLFSGDKPQGLVWATDAIAEAIGHLQYTIGEGPCVDAHTHGRAVLEPDLAVPVVQRWAGFAPPALEAGACAVFGFPVRVGAARLGALYLYRDRPGTLTEDQLADALVMADVTAKAVLAINAEAPPGTIAADLEVGANLQLVVHQAAGMVSVQLGISVGDALVRLRAHAFRASRPLGDVADDVVAETIALP